MRRLLWTTLVVMLTIAAPALAADDAPDAHSEKTKSALEKFKDAQKSFEQKDYPTALELARAALDATGSPNARLYVARSLRELGRLSEAHFELERTLKDAGTLAKTDKKYEPTRDAAAAELAILDQRVGKVVVALADAPDGTSVELNGKPLTADRVGVPVAVEPGDVVVRARGDGKQVERQIRIAAGQTQTIALVFKDAAPAPVTPVAPAKPAERPRSGSGGGLRTAGYVTAGVGVAGFVVFAVAGSMASSKFSQLESDCGSKRCTDPKYGDTVDSGKRLDTIANVGLVVGGVGVLAGGAMILFGGPSPEKTGTAALQASPGGLSLRYAHSF